MKSYSKKPLVTSRNRPAPQRRRSHLGRVTPNQILAALKEMARGRVALKDVARALTESSVNYADFTTGAKVYIMCGPGSGYRGTLKEVNSGYATVSGHMGDFWFVPVIFLQHDENPPKG